MTSTKPLYRRSLVKYKPPQDKLLVHDTVMPEQVCHLIRAITARAQRAWGEDNLIAASIAFCSDHYYGTWVVSDDYDRFFDAIYRYYPKTDTWTMTTTQLHYKEMPYTFEKAIADARAMFAGVSVDEVEAYQKEIWGELDD